MSNHESFFTGVSDSARFRAAIEYFDALNSTDPNLETVGGVSRPRELLNAERLCDWLMVLAPDASESLRLAARSQHLCRWQIPRASLEMTRAGYHQWKTGLRRFHAEKSGEVLRAVGYPDEIIAQVRDLNLKKNFPGDAESRALEDALCLVFLQFQFAGLAARTEEDKVINALQKSWKKMTPAAREQALGLSYGARERKRLECALSAA